MVKKDLNSNYVATIPELNFDTARLNNVPTSAGVYLWKNHNNDVIYIGKAKNLKHRMKQYFQGLATSYKTSNLVLNIFDFDYILTKTDREALILERNLITKYLPKFNIKLTDDKHYPYICLKLTNKLEISLTYQVKTKNSATAVYYGPFPNGYGGKKIVDLLTRIYTYDKGFPIQHETFSFWFKQFQAVKKILVNSRQDLIKTLKLRMEEAALQHHYEIAQDFKETIKAFESFEAKGIINLKTFNNLDILGFVIQDNYVAVTMLFYRQGFLLTKIDKILEITSTVEDTVRQFINQYYQFNLIPDLVISNQMVETTDLKIIIPSKGQNKQLLDLALKNAQDILDHKLAQFVRQAEATKNALHSLQKILKIQTLNHLIIVDNSHTNNTLPVSVFLTYRNGIKSPKEFRKYQLTNIDRQADVEYMRQGLTKHFIDNNHLIPDLLIVDGGIAQINEAKHLLPKFKIIGLVKDDKHQTKGIINSSGQLITDLDQNLFNFLTQIQFEVDHYAKKFHQSKRLTTLEGVLLSVPGIGPSTEKKLLNHFKTYSDIYNASTQELSKIIPLSLAKAIKKRLGETNDD